MQMHEHMHTRDGMPMTPIDRMTLDEIEHLRGQEGIPVKRLCRRAQIDDGTYRRWMRWRRGEPKGSQPNTSTLDAVRRALADLVADKNAKRAA